MANLAVSSTPIEVVRGDSWTRFLKMWADPDRTAPYDLTDKIVQAEIRWATDSQTVTVEITDASAGEVQITLDKEDTDDVPLGMVSSLFIAVTNEEEIRTWFRAPIDGLEGIAEL